MGRNRVLSGEDLYGIPGIRLQEDKFKVDRLQIIVVAKMFKALFEITQYIKLII